jgi:hypothetical protein
MLPNRDKRPSGRAPLRAPEGVRPKHGASGLMTAVAHGLATALPRRPEQGELPHPASREDAASGRRSAGILHVHHYTWYAEDPFSAHNLYGCRCGRVRPGL